MFALAGRVKNTGLIEVPMGITLRDIVYDIGGGIPEARHSRPCKPVGPQAVFAGKYLDMPVDYDTLQKLGSIMGSGGMIVMDETSSMVDVARYFMEFCMTESCGKCIPCRAGTFQMHELLKKIAEGQGNRCRPAAAGGAVRSGTGHQSLWLGANGSESRARAR